MLKYLTTMIILSSLSVANASDTKVIKLHSADSEPIPVGTLIVLEDGGYRVDWDDSKFGDFFLSMRPFKCLEGSEKLWCRVDYPYDIK